MVTITLGLNATVADAIECARPEIGEGRYQLADHVDSEPLDGNMLIADLPEPPHLFVIEMMPIPTR
jgi:hypothetical protein